MFFPAETGWPEHEKVFPYLTRDGWKRTDISWFKRDRCTWHEVTFEGKDGGHIQNILNPFEWVRDDYLRVTVKCYGPRHPVDAGRLKREIIERYGETADIVNYVDKAARSGVDNLSDMIDLYAHIIASKRRIGKIW